jgi:hypothetical protein
MSAHSATLKLDNQKNGWKGVCIHQEHNGNPITCTVWALGHCYLHVCSHGHNPEMLLSTYFENNQRTDVTDQTISAALKVAVMVLNYLSHGFPIDWIVTHSLCSGGANALTLASYSDHQIQKMGGWKGSTFKECIREELPVVSQGMSRDMKQYFQFINISGGAYHDITDTIVVMVYAVNATVA